MDKYPEELKKQLGKRKYPDPEREYTAHDLVLAYIAHHTTCNKPDGVAASDLTVYLWEKTGKVTSRGYVYRILTTLRQRGHITTTNSHKPGMARNFSTALGRTTARPHKEASCHD